MEQGLNCDVIYLDFAKAFDKVDQEALFEAMERMGIDDKLIRLTKQLYKNPTFNVDMGHQASGWKNRTQASGKGAHYLHTYSLLL